MDEHENPPDTDRRIALDARDWIVRLTSGHVSDADIQRFKLWRDSSPAHRRAFDRERVFWHQLQALDSSSDGMPPFQPPVPARRKAVARRALLVGGGAVATAAAVAVAVPWLEPWWSADFATTVGDQAAFTLPDGSVATLNTDSAIAVNFTPRLRLVSLLKGEAEFKVSPASNAPFRVAALGGNSDALGTVFSVRTLADRATVTVTEGHVRVVGPADPMGLDEASAGGVELRAGEQTNYVAGGMPQVASAADMEVATAWRSGRVIFEGRPFANAMTELNRYLPERIVIGPAVDANLPVSAIFKTSEALDAVRALARTQGRTVRRIPGVMIVIT
jgi:transmembrane sensor